MLQPLPHRSRPSVALAMLARSSTLTNDRRLRGRLDRALSAPGDPLLSFAGIMTLDSAFVPMLLAPVALARAQSGRPLWATAVDTRLRPRLERDLRDVGVLLPCADVDLTLGMPPELREVLGALRSGARPTPDALATALGIATPAADSHLAVLESYGLLPGAHTGLPVAA